MWSYTGLTGNEPGMMACIGKSALIIGGTGLIGTGAAQRLLNGGWEVIVVSRGRRAAPSAGEGIRHVQADGHDVATLRRLAAGGVDAVIDVIPYSASDAEALMELADLTASITAISSAAVYADVSGEPLLRGFESPPAPKIGPIRETQRTVAPAEAGYAEQKAAMELTLLDQDRVPVSILRPGAVFGPGDTAAREWFFVRRCLDRRPHVVLASRGQSTFHQSYSENVAELVACCARQPGRRVLNAVNERALSELEIGRLIATTLGWEWREVLLEGPPIGGVGETPWSTPSPFVLDLTEATRLGYRDVVAPEQAIARTVDWLRRVAADDPQRYLPRALDYYGHMLGNYAAEDAVIAARDAE